MASIQKELWNIFTHYSLHGNPRDPSKLTAVGFLKLCKDAMIFDATMAERPVSTADIHLIYTREYKSRETASVEKSDKLSFDEFLSCLVRIARKCYPSFSSDETALRQLLLDNILLLASRRAPVSVAGILAQPAIAALRAHFEDALLAMFKFYCYNSDVRDRGLNTTGRTFDEQKDLIKEARKLTQLQNSMANTLSYADFLRFTNDYGLLNCLGLTSLDLGEVYLSIISFDNFTTKVRYADFPEFWEAFVRIAIQAFRQYNIPTENKVKALFLYIWKFLQASIQDSTSSAVQSQGFNTYKAGIIQGSQALNEKFLAVWAKDGYIDYLDEGPGESRSAGGAGAGAGSGEAVGAEEAEEDMAFLQELIADLEVENTATAPRKSDRSYLDKASSLNQHLADLNAAQGPVVAPTVVIETDLTDKVDFQDERISGSQLRRLLALRPEVGLVLRKAMVQEGIL